MAMASYYTIQHESLRLVNSSAEKERLEILKQQAQAFAQNQGKPSLIADIIGSDNFIDLKSKLKHLEKMEMEFAQQNATTEHEREMEKINVQRDFEQLKSDLKICRQYSNK